MIDNLPKATGVYIMKNSVGKVIYVGKAINLRSRVKAYLGHDSRPFARYIQANTDKLEFIITPNEKDALLLEAQLIKTHRPRYNIFLKDDKSYVRFKITARHEWPGIYITRRILNDGSLYFGPYSSAQATKKTLSAIGRIFPVRRCKDSELRNRIRPCIYYQIGLCAAPCANKTSRKEYTQIVEDLILFLEGKDKTLVGYLKKRMEHEACTLNFEKAAKIRDQINAIKETLVPQIVVGNIKSDVDVLGISEQKFRTEIAVLHILKGSIADAEIFSIEGDGENQDTLSSFITYFYLNRQDIPRLIYAQVMPEEKKSLEAILTDKKGSKVTITYPKRGRPKKWLSLADKNAMDHIKAREDTSVLDKIAKHLHLSHIPYRMECYDISSIQALMRLAQGLFL